jgi:hypothetical protein
MEATARVTGSGSGVAANRATRQPLVDQASSPPALIAVSDGLPAVQPVSAASVRPALLSREVDFWLLGGASIVVWLLAFSLQGFRSSSWAVDHHFGGIVPLTTSLVLIVNHPHFIASYRLAYGQGGRFVRRYWFQLILVPVVLLALFVVAYVGLRTRPGQGRLLMGALVSLMLFTVGWHYSKQAYGATMVQARYEGYRLSAWERRWFKLSLFSVWWVSFARNNIEARVHDFHGFQYRTLGLPSFTYLAASFVNIVCAVAVICILVRRYRSSRQLPSSTLLAPIVALHLWWLPVFYQYEFYMFLVPLFHSLQYLAFVHRIEHQKQATTPGRSAPFRKSIIFLAIVLVGFLAFELVPNTLDVTLGTHALWKAFFFYAAFSILINVHHYFIDNVLWRFENDMVKRYLV